MTLKDSFGLAYRTVVSNRLRSGITIAIIAFGIMALIGIITCIDAMNKYLTESFATMGANSFSIGYKERFRFNNNNDDVQKVKKGRKQKKSNLDKFITIREAEQFKDLYKYPAVVSIEISGGNGYEIHYKQKKTNPNVNIRGGNEHFVGVNGFTLAAGRNLNALDVETGRNVCILGGDVVDKLFGENIGAAVDKVIKLGNTPYRVVGVLAKKGNSALMRADNVVITSYGNARSLANASSTFRLSVAASNVVSLEGAVNEAEILFRNVRRLHPTDDNNFVIEKSDKIAQTFIGLLGSIQGAAAAIGLITLIGAAIGLMNIMLVAVNERTKEVGLIKALGGKRRDIKNQFLFESTIISVMGAIFGIILGVLVGNIFALVLGTGFVVPWSWVVLGIVICSGVGLAAGLWPALKASRLDPIVALRHD
ncbi:MAG: ABC transporter permease [Bacteroidetes bacterium]|nr:MAG: ABC transporter permease [Bacteroidota bacterium]TAF96569.1 MAG: ABC transporter permease [Bacteroidota bacterium]